MPNVPPRGMFSSKRSLNETPVPGTTAVVDAKATLPGEVVPRQVLEVWASGASGVPQLVWVKDANSPTTAVVSYVAATPASGGHVHMTWTNPNPIRSDSYRILRPDGSLAGTTTQLATSFDDPAPRPLNGTYKLVAMLGSAADPSPGVSNSLNMSTGPTAFAVTIPALTYGRLTWGHPAWGKPHQYQVFRDGALYVTLDGAALIYDDVNPTRGQTHTYQVFPVLAGVRGGGTAVLSLAYTPLDPINVQITSPAADLLQLTFNYPGGAIARYEIQRYDGNSPGWINHDLNNTSGVSNWGTTTNVGYMRVRSVGINGQVSDWEQQGPIASIVAPPVIQSFLVLSTGFAQVVAITNPGSELYCAEYYLVNFPGWRAGPFLSSGSSSSQCQPGGGGGVVWWEYERFQSSPSYARVKRVRNGVDSEWTQVGPV